MDLTERDGERFWSKVDKSGECWLRSTRAKCGYAHFSVRLSPGKWRSQLAHRVAWLLVRGTIPSGLFVLHSCDTRSCVNPEHLFLGTHDDNMRDMVRKGRAAKPWLGVSLPTETRRKISLSLRGNTHLLGYKHSIEARRKISAALIGNT